MYKEIIEKYFDDHREEFLKDLGELISVESVKGEEKPGMPYGEGPAEALKTALSIAEKYGLYTENWENYLGIVQLEPGEARKLDILCHLDVVPVTPEKWTVTEPFRMKEVDGRVYGRGTTDDKGPALFSIYALRAIKELNLPCRDAARVFLGCDEENGSSELKYYFDRTSPAEMTLSPDAGWPVINTEKGIMSGTVTKTLPEGEYASRVKGGTATNAVPAECELEIRGMKEVVAGTPAHASMPEKGDNAITKAIELLSKRDDIPAAEGEMWKALSELFPHGDYSGEALGIAMDNDITGPLTLSLDIIDFQGGKLTATFDSRLPLGFGSEEAEKLAEKIESKGFSFAHIEAMPHHVPEDTEFVQALLKAYEEYTGKEGYCYPMGGLTYCHNIENAVAFGAEYPDTDYAIHGNDEFAVVDELLEGGKIYTSAIIKLCN